MARERLERVFNPGRVVVQVHTAGGVVRVPPRGRVVVTATAGPEGDHLRSLLASSVLRSEGPVDPPAEQTAARKTAARKTAARKTAAEKGVAKKTAARKSDATKTAAETLPT